MVILYYDITDHTKRGMSMQHPQRTKTE